VSKGTQVIAHSPKIINFDGKTVKKFAKAVISVSAEGMVETPFAPSKKVSSLHIN
jgi:hypothetical protein